MGVRLRLYGCERMRRERMIGECIVSFSSLPAAMDYPLEQWLTLEPRSNITVRIVITHHTSALHYPARVGLKTADHRRTNRRPPQDSTGRTAEHTAGRGK